MKEGKQIWIPLVIIVLIVLNLFTAYQYSTLAQKLDCLLYTSRCV